MASREDILRRLVEAKQDLQDRFKIRAIALFGSYARGEQRSDTDVDVLVDVAPSIGLEFVSLGDALEQRLGVRVDLVSRRAVQPRKWAYIESELIHV